MPEPPAMSGGSNPDPVCDERTPTVAPTIYGGSDEGQGCHAVGVCGHRCGDQRDFFIPLSDRRCCCGCALSGCGLTRSFLYVARPWMLPWSSSLHNASISSPAV